MTAGPDASDQVERAAVGATGDAPSGGTGQPGTTRTFVRRLGGLEKVIIRRETGPVAGLIILAIIFQTASGGQFLSNNELSGIVTLGAPLCVIAIGVCLLMISGEFDLSVAGVYAIAPILLGELMTKGWNEWLAMFLVLLAALGVGFVNGYVTTRFVIPSLITTLATYYILQGVSYDITNGQTVLQFGKSLMFTVFGAAIGGTFLSAVMLWAIGLLIVMWVILQHTTYGNWTFAAGARNNAGRAMGVPVKRVKITNFMICALLAAFAGCLQFASFGGASPGNGTGFELLAIVACVIGGTSLFGVKGSIVGAFLGALTIATLQTGLVLIGAPGNAYESLIGVILILTVIVNQQIAGADGIARKVGLLLAFKKGDDSDG
jgi:simple sugar transport system permease protein